LQYLVSEEQGRPVACLLFGAAAWQCADRDRYLRWEPAQRAQHLHGLANNTRFLILPGLPWPQLARAVLSQASRRLSRDWQAQYGHPIYVLESFVEHGHFTGACYRAANWVPVGQTKGRSRQDRPDGTRDQVPIKDIYLYPLHRRFRQYLQGSPLRPPA
jgi:Druantia protein DruA